MINKFISFFMSVNIFIMSLFGCTYVAADLKEQADGNAQLSYLQCRQRKSGNGGV